MDILIVAQYCDDITDIDANNSRFIYLADMLKMHNHNVEIITTDYIHNLKRHIRSLPQHNEIKFTVLHESGYPRNVCLKRFISHKELARNIKKYLNTRKNPDVVYVAIPSLDVSKVMADYCKRKNIRFIVDIQDLWPEAFKMVFNIPHITDKLYKPMTKQANSIYGQADEIIAVSKTYAERALQVNIKCHKAHVVYLGTEKKRFDTLTQSSIETQINPEINKYMKKTMANGSRIIRIVYCGTLGHSYDLPVVFKALKILTEKGIANIQFWVLGDGPRRKIFQEMALNLPVFFTGNLSYNEMVWVLSQCDISINPIMKGAAQSIINKHMDYAMSGLPVINTQECVEYRELISQYQCGINCNCGISEEVATAITTLMNDEELRINMGKQHRRMAEDLFDRSSTYQTLVELVEKNEKKNIEFFKKS